MIPAIDIEPRVIKPLPRCEMPAADEITEEGFGGFRGTWFIGRALAAEAQAILREEAEIIDWLDSVATDAQMFDALATAIEHHDPDDNPDEAPDGLGASLIGEWLRKHPRGEEDGAPLEDLEIGVAGLTYALSAVRCLTAASCRGHVGRHSWSSHPVVFFAAPEWRVEILAPLIAAEGCGLEGDRGMLFAYAASIRDTHRLAKRILTERSNFRRMPDRWRRTPRSATMAIDQMVLPLESGWNGGWNGPA